jgi:acyl-CoA thioesterase FadM
VFIWVKSWGQIIEAARARLEFFQEQLEYSADDESALAYLRKIHQQYLPKVLLEDEVEVEITTELSPRTS